MSVRRFRDVAAPATLVLGWASGLPSCGSGSVPETVTAAECRAGGGQVIAASCPPDTEPLRVLVADGRTCCTDSSGISPDQCTAMGGETHLSPGNGIPSSCPDGGTLLSSHIQGAIEGGICCRP